LVALPNSVDTARANTWAVHQFVNGEFVTVPVGKLLPAETILYSVPGWDSPRPVITPPPTKYTLTFNSEGGSSWPAETGNAGTSVMLNLLPVRAGYTFTGWFTSPTGGTQVTSPHVLTANITVYAQWKANVTPAANPGVMIVMMENQQASNIYGSANAPFLTALGNPYPTVGTYFGDSHPSLPNYIALATGIHACAADDNPPSQHPELVGKANLFSQLDAAGIPWGAFFESLTGNPQTNEGPTDSSGNQLYEPHHNPIAYVGTSAQIAKCQSYTQAGLVSFLQSAKSNAFVFVVPNFTDNMHDPVGNPSSSAAAVKAGDTWLSTFLPVVQASAWYKSGGIVIITWDEADDTSGSDVNGGFNGVTGGPIATFIVSAALNNVPATALPNEPFNGTWSGAITHIGLLQSIEKFYGLGLLGGAGYGDISSLFEYSAGVVVTPPIITPPPPGGYPSGLTIPASIPGFTRDFTDFKNGIDSAFWTTPYDGTSNPGGGRFMATHCVVTGGDMTIEAYQDPAANDSAANNWGGGGIQTQQRYPVGTTFYSVVRKDTYGSWFAIQLLMGDTWPPEDDIEETTSANSDTESIHWGAANQQIQAQKSGLDLTDWGLWVHTWTATKITTELIVGDVTTLIASVTNPDSNAGDPNSDVQPMFYSFQMQTESGSTPNDPSVTASNPVKFQLEQFAAFTPG
jgi:uncharacterized repeat protein (TIGR02543 family)